MRAPTRIRLLNTDEWAVVTGVFGSGNLPFRQRIFITDALGGGNAPFTIPTSAISVSTIPAMISAGLSAVIASATGPVGNALGTIHNVLGWAPSFGAAIPAQIGSLFNLGYLVNIGPTHYPGMTANAAGKNLLVHELTHVWQGRNSIFAMTYVINSAFHQCKATLGSGARGSAYNFTPGSNFRTYNAEQQANIVDTWFDDGSPHSGDLWPYIRDYVRHGKA